MRNLVLQITQKQCGEEVLLQLEVGEKARIFFFSGYFFFDVVRLAVKMDAVIDFSGSSVQSHAAKWLKTSPPAPKM